MSSSDSEPDSGLDLFAEPTDYYPPPPAPTTETHTLQSGHPLTVRLVGHNPLWGHHLWNAGRIISTYFETHPALVRGRSVLELGAGAGLPSLISARLGASMVVASDYPDQSLVDNLRWNIAHCGGAEAEPSQAQTSKTEPSKAEGGEAAALTNIVAEGFLWGADPAPLLAHLPTPAAGFDVLILADLLFNHSEHAALLATVTATLSHAAGAQALVFFTPYRPWLLQKDLAFFELAKGAGFAVEKVLEEKMERVMFEEDRGDEEVRRTVFGYVMTWAEEGGR